MKLTEKTLKKMIAEAYEKYEPGPMTAMTVYDTEKPDPMDALFRIMDVITDKALTMLKADLGEEFNYIDVEAQLTPLSNEVVTQRLQKTGRVDEVDSMARELIERYMEMKGLGQSHPGAI
jgi:hypothetical protein